ncbi:head-tail adaptor protein [Schlesneria paludicola]|uniref:phage head completion protein n=1 Tax=Schlesneria paludicola TaxID=360056 RepID=UPI00029AEB05|nr:head-tail adaptor protein [Schlesneria paludicola]
MPASKRRDPIVVQRLKQDATPNVLGEMAVESPDNWETYLVGFAEVIFKGQREFTRAGIVDADVSHLVRLPFSSEALAITSEMRLLLEVTGELLHIEAAYRRDASNREVEMLCRH